MSKFCVSNVLFFDSPPPDDSGQAVKFAWLALSLSASRVGKVW